MKNFAPLTVVVVILIIPPLPPPPRAVVAFNLDTNTAHAGNFGTIPKLNHFLPKEPPSTPYSSPIIKPYSMSRNEVKGPNFMDATPDTREDCDLPPPLLLPSWGV